MTFKGEKPRCSECRKTSSIALCYGCEQSFCTQHFIQHRLDLGEQMDVLHEKYQSINKCLKTNPNEHSTMLKIDLWEKKSIRKIRDIAEVARKDFRRWFDEIRLEVEEKLKRIDVEFRQHENFDNFTEIDLQRWTKQLNELKNLIETSTKLPVVEEKKILSSGEQFVQIFGPSRLSDDRLVVRQGDYRFGLSQLTGTHEYSSGRHSIEFLIEKKGEKNLFFGIQSTRVQNDSSINGWWNFDHLIVNGESVMGKSQNFLQTADSIRLILDCDREKLTFEHFRTKEKFDLPINLVQCPFPWKFLVRLLTTDDQLRITG